MTRAKNDDEQRFPSPSLPALSPNRHFEQREAIQELRKKNWMATPSSRARSDGFILKGLAEYKDLQAIVIDNPTFFMAILLNNRHNLKMYFVMLFSLSFLRVGCCAFALQIVTSFPSVAMTGDAEDRGSKPATPRAHVDKADPSYNKVKSFVGREPVAEEVAAYPEFDALFKDSMLRPTKAQFKDYLTAKSAGIMTIKKRTDLYEYQTAKDLLGTSPTKEQFEAYNTLQKKNTYRNPTKAEIEEQVKKGSESANLL